MSHEVIMPALGMAQDTAIILTWHKQPGDPVSAGDVLMEVETDKAAMEVEAGYDGVVVELRAEVDVPVAVGQVIAVIAESAEAYTSLTELDIPASDSIADKLAEAEPSDSQLSTSSKSIDAPTKVEQEPSPVTVDRVFASPKAKYQAHVRGIDLNQLVAAGVNQPFHVSDLDQTPGQDSTARVSASPKVRKLARERGIDLGELAAATGQRHVTLADLAQPASGIPDSSSAQSAFWQVDHSQYGPVECVELTRLEQYAAANLKAAQQLIPAVTHHDRVSIDLLEKVRADLAKEPEHADIRLTALAFHIKALSKALIAFPRFNASLSVDGKGLWLKQYVDIGVAVNTPFGLKVAAVRGCDKQTPTEIAVTVQDLATRARERKIRPEEMGGTGMSISNLGSKGPEFFTPIINPPEVAILGVSRSSIEPVWTGSTFAPVSLAPLSLTYDHRVINGADAVAFLDFYKNLLLKPWKLLV